MKVFTANYYIGHRGIRIIKTRMLFGIAGKQKRSLI